MQKIKQTWLTASCGAPDSWRVPREVSECGCSIHDACFAVRDAFHRLLSESKLVLIDAQDFRYCQRATSSSGCRWQAKMNLSDFHAILYRHNTAKFAHQCKNFDIGFRHSVFTKFLVLKFYHFKIYKFRSYKSITDQLMHILWERDAAKHGEGRKSGNAHVKISVYFIGYCHSACSTWGATFLF